MDLVFLVSCFREAKLEYKVDAFIRRKSEAILSYSYDAGRQCGADCGKFDGGRDA